MVVVGGNQSTRPTPKRAAQPGRNSRGQWLGDDDATVQVLRALTEVVTQLALDCDAHFTYTTSETDFYASKIRAAQAGLGMIDVGTKPKGDDDAGDAAAVPG